MYLTLQHWGRFSCHYAGVATASTRGSCGANQPHTSKSASKLLVYTALLELALLLVGQACVVIGDSWEVQVLLGKRSTHKVQERQGKDGHRGCQGSALCMPLCAAARAILLQAFNALPIFDDGLKLCEIVLSPLVPFDACGVHAQADLFWRRADSPVHYYNLYSALFLRSLACSSSMLVRGRPHRSTALGP